MKASELRIGNYVNTPRADQSPFRIDIIEFASKNNIKVGMNVHKLPHPFNENEFIDAHPLTWELQDLKPIELTEEILLKIKGIKQEGLTFRIGKYILWYYNGESYSFMLYKEKDDRPDDLKVYSIELTKVKYLHQLQNVFYSLENEELEINL